MEVAERHAVAAHGYQVAMHDDRAKRDGHIRLANQHGLSTRRIAAVVGVSYGRVAQILREGSNDA